MATMDVFNSSAFSTTSLTGAVNKIPYKPDFLGSLGIFTPMPVRTRNVFVDRRDGKMTLIGSSADGAPPEELSKDSRDAVPLKTVRLAKGNTIRAAEVQGIRAFGGDTELQAVMAEYLRGQSRVRVDMEATHEYHRLAAVQGKLLDADGSVIYDYFTEFAESEVAAINFALNVDTTNVRTKCHAVVRGMAKSSKGSFTTSTEVHALAGDEFFDKLVDHPNVREAYKNYAAASDLTEGKAFGAFKYGGITWHNYRGTDNDDIAIGSTEARFFPVNGRDIFKKAMSPLESIQHANTPGQDLYSILIRDLERNFWVRGEQYSYPLYFCQQPRVLRKAVLSV